MADTLLDPIRLPINNLINVVTSRRRGLEMAKQLGFSLPDATKIAVVISELARNITLYTEGGSITLIAHIGERKGIKVIAQDNGPGITVKRLEALQCLLQGIDLNLLAVAVKPIQQFSHLPGTIGIGLE